MPDTPDKEKSSFQKEGLTFPPPKPGGKQAPKPPARPVPPIQFDRPTRPAEERPPPRNGKPARKTVLPKGFGPKPEEPPPREETQPPPQPASKKPSAASKPEAKSSKPPSKPGQTTNWRGIRLRRRPRAFTGFLAGMLYVLIVLGVSLWLGSTAWSWALDVLALQKTPLEATIVYTEDMGIPGLAKLLKEKGLIEYEWLFRLYCEFSDAEEKIAPGEYVTKVEEDSSAKDYRALVHMLTPGSLERAQVTVTFREGLSMEQIFQLLEENKVAGVRELEEAAATVNWRYAYLKNLPAVPNRLEGYLFPETFTFYVNESPVTALQKFVREFDRRLTAEMREHVQASGYTLHEIITIASMIEAESGADMEERKNIASVIYNRLDSPDFSALQIDATLLYYMGGRREITVTDQQTDNPYNTYLYPGLPPGPICSPSIDSIRAALYPNSTRFYYYLLDDDDVTQFSRTYDEHLQKRASYDRYN